MDVLKRLLFQVTSSMKDVSNPASCHKLVGRLVSVSYDCMFGMNHSCFWHLFSKMEKLKWNTVAPPQNFSMRFHLYIKQVYFIQSNFKMRKNTRKSMSVRRLCCSSILVSLRWIIPCVRLFLVFYTDPQKLPDPAGGHKSRMSEERRSWWGSVPDGLRTGAHHRAESRQRYQRLWGSADR